MGFSLPDTSLPYPPPPPPSLTVLKAAPIEAFATSEPIAPEVNFTRCFMVLIGNIKGADEKGNVLDALDDFYVTSNDPGIDPMVVKAGGSLSFDIVMDKSISMYIWTKGIDLENAVQLKDLHLNNKKLTFSYVEMIESTL